MQRNATSAVNRQLLAWAASIALLNGCSGSGVPVTANSGAAAITATSGVPAANAAGPTASTPAPPASSANAIALQGVPPATATAGSAYVFQPAATQSGAAVVFSIVNKPAWAYFSIVTGGLAGIPLLSDLGTTRSVTITVSNGKSRATIGPFDVTVALPAAAPAPPPGSPPVGQPAPSPGGSGGSAALAWQAPTQNMDGTPLTDLAGYHIDYGTSADTLTLRIAVPGAASTAYVINGLARGTTYFFAVTAFDTRGIDSRASNLVSKAF